VSRRLLPTPLWSTAAYGDKAETTPQELSALGEHLDLCRDTHGHVTALHAAMQAMHGFGASRFITTLLLVGLLMTLLLLMF
jgi:hypothetical protein